MEDTHTGGWQEHVIPYRLYNIQYDIYTCTIVAQAAQISKAPPHVYSRISHDFLEYIHIFEDMTSLNKIKVIFHGITHKDTVQ